MTPQDVRLRHLPLFPPRLQTRQLPIRFPVSDPVAIYALFSPKYVHFIGHLTAVGGLKGAVGR